MAKFSLGNYGSTKVLCQGGERSGNVWLNVTVKGQRQLRGFRGLGSKEKEFVLGTVSLLKNDHGDWELNGSSQSWDLLKKAFSAHLIDPEWFLRQIAKVRPSL